MTRRGVVIAITPVTAPAGTVVVTVARESTVKDAPTPSEKVTAFVCCKSRPRIWTMLPTLPAIGQKPVIRLRLTAAAFAGAPDSDAASPSTVL